MKTILLAALAAFSICAQTTITDIVKAPTGELFRGLITITTPNQMTHGGETYVGWQKTIRIRSADNGAFSQALIPNDNATPADTSYTVQYLPDQGTGWTEFWIVTTSGSPLKINQVRVAKAPTVNLSIIAAQITGGTNGFCLKSNGFVGVWGACGGGGTWGSITGTLTAQTDLASALSGKEPTITAGTSLQVWLGNKTWQNISGLSIDWSQVFNAPTFFTSAGYGLSGTGSEVSADDAELVSYQWSMADPAGIGALGKLHIRTTTGELFFGDGSQWLGLAKRVHTHVAADVSDLTTATRGLFTGTAGRISYNSSTGAYDLVGGIVSAGVCLKPTVDTYGRVTGCASLASGDIPNNAANTSGNAATATALAANGGNCPSGQYPKGVDASGAAEGCAVIPNADLPDMVGDSGSGGTKGAVPAPAAGDGAAGKYLKADGTWSVPAGGGGVSIDTTIFKANDEFCFGATGTGAIGELGWFSATIAGTVTSLSYQAGSATNPCIISNHGVTTANANDGRSIYGVTPFHDATNSINWQTVFVFALNANTDNRVRVGLSNQTGNLAPTNFIGLRSDANASWENTATPNFRLTVCNSNTLASCADYDTGVATDTAFHKLSVRSTVAGTILIKFDSATERSFCNSGCDVSTSGKLPASTTDFMPIFIIGNNSTAARTMSIDYYAALITSIVR